MEGWPPTIDIAVGYSKSNTSPIIKPFLSRLDELVERSQKHWRKARVLASAFDLGEESEVRSNLAPIALDRALAGWGWLPRKSSPIFSGYWQRHVNAG